MLEDCTFHTMQGATARQLGFAWHVAMLWDEDQARCRSASRLLMNEVQRHSTSPMTPLLRTAGRRIPWRPQERSSELPQMLSMVQRYGAHSLFMTMNQDLVLDDGTAEGVVTYAARYMMKTGRTREK